MSEIIIPKAFKDLFNPEYRYKCYWGGRGGAKSESFGRASLILTSSQPTRFLCTREIQNSIKDSVYKLLVDLIDGYGLWGYRILRDAITHKNGSEYLFKGLYNNIQSIKSLQDIDRCWVEEAQTISKQSLDILLPTIRAKDSEIWFSFNRLEEDDAIWTELCEEPDSKTLVKKVNWNDNPFFPEVLDNERLRCLKFRPDDYQTIWEGEPEKQAGGLVVKNFTDDNIKPIAYQRDMDLHITCDFNVDPMCWILAHKTADKVFFFDEIVLENTTTYKTIEEFHSRYAGHEGKIIINGDASGDNRSVQSEYANYAQMRNRLSALGYRDIELRLRHFNPRIKSRIAAWNNKVVDLKGNRCILIDPKCKWLIHNCKKLKYKEGSSEVDVPTSNQIKNAKGSDKMKLKALEHPFDAASYLVEYYYPVKFEHSETIQEKPQGISPYNFDHILNKRG